MGYKLICIDVDGTLFGEDKFISEENKKAIESAYKKGIEVVISTGRIYVNAVQIANRLNVKSPVISANGAVVKDWYNGKRIFHSSFSIKECEELLELIHKHNLVAHFYTMDRVISNKLIGNLAAQIYKYKNNHKKYKIYVDRSISYKTLRKRFKEYEGHIVKCVLYSIDQQDIKSFRDELEESTEMSIFGAGRYSVEVSPKGVSKGKAVEILSKHLNINREEIMCIGDNENDIEMIKYAGLGVAMGNGVDELKEVADYITDLNINSGVGKAINKFVL